MKTIIAAFDEITRLATTRTPERDAVEDLWKKVESIGKGLKTMIDMGVVKSVDVLALSKAHIRTNTAVNAAFEALAKRQTDLIEATTTNTIRLHPMPTPATLKAGIQSGERTVTHQIRNHGEDFQAWQDGRSLGCVSAHGIEATKTHLEVEGVGKWLLDDIEALGDEDGMAILLRNGTLVEIRSTP